MTDFDDVVCGRRSIRKYQAREVPQELIDEVIDLARLAPSRTNVQPWRFVVIRSQETRRKLCRACHFQKIVLRAPVIVAVFGDMDAWTTVPLRTSELVSASCFGAEVKNAADKVLVGLDVDQIRTITAKNTAIAATILHLAAASRGLGSCWVKLLQEDAVRRILGAPSAYYLAGLFTIGFPAEAPPSRPRLPREETVFYERVGA